MECPYLISSIGLGLDIVGVILVWVFAVQLGPRPGGASFLELEQADPVEAKKAIWFQWMSRVGLAMILLGFGFQILGNSVLSSSSGVSVFVCP